MNTHNLCCIGHITLDKIVTPKRTLHMPGGTSFYFAHGMSKLDTSDFLLVTALAVSEMDAVEEIRRKGIDVKVLPSTHSVYFENTYGENQNNRTQRVLAKADPFTVEGLQDVDARIVSIPSTPFFYIKKALADFVYQLKPLLITQRKSFCNCREATSRSPLRSDRLGGAVRFP